jgi:ankyrin repeat protein
MTCTGRVDKLLEKLQNRDTDPLERCPDDGNTALHTVIKSTPTPALRMLRLSPLRHSVFYNLLAQVKQDCSPQNGCEETPLHTAILTSQTEMALMLIEAGANLSLRDNLERTPLDLAKELELDEVVFDIEHALETDIGEDHHEGLEGTDKKPILDVVRPPRSSRRMQKHGLILERRRLV